jgi:hypothetical protein
MGTGHIYHEVGEAPAKSGGRPGTKLLPDEDNAGSGMPSDQDRPSVIFHQVIDTV